MGEAIESCNFGFFYDPTNGIDLSEIGSHLTCHEIHELHDMGCNDNDIEGFLNTMFLNGSRPECDEFSKFDHWFHSRYNEDIREVMYMASFLYIIDILTS